MAHFQKQIVYGLFYIFFYHSLFAESLTINLTKPHGNEKQYRQAENTPAYKDRQTQKDEFTIHIVVNNLLSNLGNNLKSMFEKMGMPCTIHYVDHGAVIPYDIIKKAYAPNQYLFMVAFQIYTYLDMLPENKFFLYQLEQLNSLELMKTRMTEANRKSIIRSCKTFDCFNKNLSHYEANLKNKIVCLTPPIVLQDNLCENNSQKDIGVLFYGAITDRRKNILTELKKDIKNIVIKNNCSGTDMIKILKRTKVLINLHSYEEGFLETCRLHEALPYVNSIVSEKPCKEDMESIEMYKDLDGIEFVDIGDIKGLSNAIRKNLATNIKRKLPEKAPMNQEFVEKISQIMKEVNNPHP